MTRDRNRQILFTVKGKGAFPADMLRHDACWPVDGDINCVSNPFLLEKGAEATVVLATRGHVTTERWRSFGWIVTDIDGRHGPYY